MTELFSAPVLRWVMLAPITAAAAIRRPRALRVGQRKKWLHTRALERQSFMTARKGRLTQDEVERIRL
jgi:hypothetical protein